MTKGKLLIIGLGLVIAVGGAGLYYLQGHHYYQRVSGVASITIGGASFAVTGYDGLDNPALPLRLRGCFTLTEPAAALAAGAPTEKFEPFAAPGWFDCWDPAALDRDLKAGRAKAVIAERAGEGDFATERVVVIYPDGRGYQWRRLQKDPG